MALFVLLFASLWLVIRWLCLVVESWSLRRSRVWRCVGVHECHVEGVRAVRTGTMRPVNRKHARGERVLQARAGNSAVADVSDPPEPGREFE